MSNQDSDKIDTGVIKHDAVDKMFCEPEGPTHFARAAVVTILIGPEEQALTIHRNILIEKCPYFASRLRDCWDGKHNEPLKLTDVNVAGFEVVVDWIYSDRLPPRVLDPSNNEWWMFNRLAYKAADRLMMTDLQNELVSNDLRMLRNHDMCWTLVDVFGMGKLELDHTPYYQLILKSAVHAIMAMPPKEEIANEEIIKLSDCPSAMADVLRHINKYNRKPWQHVETGDWCEYHIHANGNKCNAAKS